MSRPIRDIYNEIITERNKRLELYEVKSDSKLSVLNAIAWIVAAAIHSFETLWDVFALDVSEMINNRINGTPVYYVNALLQYQQGDSLSMREDGLAWGYNSIDETKKIITQVSYVESSDDVNLDNKLILKVATGEKGNLSAISTDELVQIQTYIQKIRFAGTRIEIISREGDILLPYVSVYYDGSIPESEVYDYIDEKLKSYIMNIPFDSSVYVSKVIEAIQSVEHVTDVYIDDSEVPEQGIFLASRDADGNLKTPQKIQRMRKTDSGFLKESSRQDQEKDLPTFRESMKLIIDRR